MRMNYFFSENEAKNRMGQGDVTHPISSHGIPKKRNSSRRMGWDRIGLSHPIRSPAGSP